MINIIFILAAAVIFVVLLKLFHLYIDHCFGEWKKLAQDEEYRAYALERIGRKLEKTPDNFGLLQKRADIHALAGDYRASSEDLGRLVIIDPSCDTAWCELAEALIYMECFPEALGAIDKAIEIDGECSEYHFVKLRTLLFLDRAEDARKSFAAWTTQPFSDDGGKIPLNWPKSVDWDDCDSDLYRAEIELSTGGDSSEILKEIRSGDLQNARDIVQDDPALKCLRKLLLEDEGPSE